MLRDVKMHGEGAATVAATGATSLAARYLEKKTRLFFDFFHAPLVPVSPGLPGMTRRLIKTSAPDLNNWVD